MCPSDRTRIRVRRRKSTSTSVNDTSAVKLDFVLFRFSYYVTKGPEEDPAYVLHRSHGVGFILPRLMDKISSRYDRPHCGSSADPITFLAIGNPESFIFRSRSFFSIIPLRVISSVHCLCAPKLGHLIRASCEI